MSIDTGHGMEPETAIDPWLVPGDIAQEMHVSKDKVNRMCRTGELDGVQFGHQWRIRRSAFEAYLRAHSSRKQEDNRNQAGQ